MLFVSQLLDCFARKRHRNRLLTVRGAQWNCHLEKNVDDQHIATFMMAEQRSHHEVQLLLYVHKTNAHEDVRVILLAKSKALPI
jgi:hypothetical protein